MLNAPSLSSKFPRSARLLKSAHFRHVMKAGRRLSKEWIAIDFRLGKTSRPKLGITVSKKYGKAHDRNRFKRLVRASFRELYLTLPGSIEINVYPRKFHPELNKHMLVRDLSEMVQEINTTFCVPLNPAHVKTA